MHITGTCIPIDHYNKINQEKNQSAFTSDPQGNQALSSHLNTFMVRGLFND